MTAGCKDIRLLPGNSAVQTTDHCDSVFKHFMIFMILIFKLVAIYCMQAYKSLAPVTHVIVSGV